MWKKMVAPLIIGVLLGYLSWWWVAFVSQRWEQQKPTPVQQPEARPAVEVLEKGTYFDCWARYTVLRDTETGSRYLVVMNGDRGGIAVTLLQESVQGEKDE